MNIDINSLIQDGGTFPAWSAMTQPERDALNVAKSEKRIRIEGTMIVPIPKPVRLPPVACRQTRKDGDGSYYRSRSCDRRSWTDVRY